MAEWVEAANCAVVVGGFRFAADAHGLGTAGHTRVDEGAGGHALGSVAQDHAAGLLPPPLQHPRTPGDPAAAALDSRRPARGRPTDCSVWPRSPADSDRVADRAGAAVDQSVTASTCVT